MAESNQSYYIQDEVFNPNHTNNFPTAVVCNSRLTPPLTNSPGRCGSSNNDFVNSDVGQLADFEQDTTAGSEIYIEKEVKAFNLTENYAPKPKTEKPIVPIPMVKIRCDGKKVFYTGDPPPSLTLNDLEKHYLPILKHAFESRMNEYLTTGMDLFAGLAGGGEQRKADLVIDKALFTAYSNIFRHDQRLIQDSNRSSVMCPNHSSRIVGHFLDILYFGKTYIEHFQQKDVTLIGEVMDLLGIPITTESFDSFPLDVNIKLELDVDEPPPKTPEYVFLEDEIDYVADGSSCYILSDVRRKVPQATDYLTKPGPDPRSRYHAFIAFKEGCKMVRGKHHSIMTLAKRAKLLEKKRREILKKQIRESRIECITIDEDQTEITKRRRKRTITLNASGNDLREMGSSIESGEVIPTFIRKIEPHSTFLSQPTLQSNPVQQTSTNMGEEAAAASITHDCGSGGMWGVAYSPVVVVPPPVVVTPDAPVVATPVALVETIPNAPIETTPGAPVETAPSAPFVATPFTPVVATPVTPVVGVPVPPVETTPSAPFVAAPVTPVVATPATPVETAPSAPFVATTMTPVVAIPVAPVETTTSAPFVAKPVVPAEATPIAPAVVPPVAPVDTTPNAPAVVPPVAVVSPSCMTPSASPPNPGENVEQMPQLSPIINPETRETGDDQENDAEIPELDNINEQIQLAQSQNMEHLSIQKQHEPGNLDSTNIKSHVTSQAAPTATNPNPAVCVRITNYQLNQLKIKARALNQKLNLVQDDERPSTSAAAFRNTTKTNTPSPPVPSSRANVRMHKSRKRKALDRPIVVGSKKIPVAMKVDLFVEDSDDSDNEGTGAQPSTATAPSASSGTPSSNNLPSTSNNEAQEDARTGRLRRRVRAIHPRETATSNTRTTRTGTTATRGTKTRRGRGRGRGR